MSLDMLGTVDPVMASRPDGGVTIVRAASGSYDYDAGGVWVPGTPTAEPAPLASIQAATPKDAELSVEMGGTAKITDLRNVYINDGTALYPADHDREADYVQFSDGLDVRKWRVVASDNRPWHNYCKALVERTREEVVT